MQAISECIPTWVQKLVEGYEDDEQAKRLMTELAISADSHPGYKLQNGVLRYKGRVWVGNNKTAQHHILIVLHEVALEAILELVQPMLELSSSLPGQV